ncbi:MAG: DsbA family protein [Burkholderiaceae bacterium]
MTIALTYLFDPLCGWCYGASPVVQQLGQHTGVKLVLSPTGLFSGSGRTMDAAFAAYAWSNDQRIQTLTGQRFTEAYRQQVLGRNGSAFDSAAASLALTAVAMTDAPAELNALKHLQEARYVQGLDTCDIKVVADVLRDIGQGEAAERLLANDAALLQANQNRLRKAQQLMHSLGAQGVPALLIDGAQGQRLVRGQLLYGKLEQLFADVWT